MPIIDLKLNTLVVLTLVFSTIASINTPAQESDNNMTESSSFSITLTPTSTTGNLKKLDKPSVLLQGQWCEYSGPEDGFEYRFAPGTLASANFLTCDLLLDCNQAAVFGIHLKEGDDGPEYTCHFGLLNQCQARIRLPLESVQQNRWMYPREGAWMKIITSGDIVDLNKVDRMTFRLWRRGDHPVQMCVTPMIATAEQPEQLTDPILPKGILLDELGQSTLTDWPGKTLDKQQMIDRLQEQFESAPQKTWPGSFSKYGGWMEKQFEATGYFHTHHDGQRWWLVDPQGYAFWSAGLDCVRSHVEGNVNNLETAVKWIPTKEQGFGDALYQRHGQQMADYLRANLIRAFGQDQLQKKWATVALSMLRDFGFNTVANWSDWQIAAEAQFPYVRPLSWPAPDGPNAPRIFRDFPDVFDPVFEKEASHYAKQLQITRDDPALIGYFLMNEPQWGFAGQTPAEGMLYNYESGPAREALATFLRKKYVDDVALAAAWGADANFDKVTRGKWTKPLNAQAKSDLEKFSALLADKLYAMLNEACKQVDANHLNLGARYYRVPPDWALQSMAGFDVFSVNCYREKVDRDLAIVYEKLNLPIMVGEWHFGALDVGLPASGIGRVATQADRGKAYRVYVEDAAAQPWCVGVHYFTLYDQPWIGRYDGENYNIGFIDICHNPYQPLVDAARLSHQRIYPIAAGQAEPCDDAPDYLPRLFY